MATLIGLICDNCGIPFNRTAGQRKHSIEKAHYKHAFCSGKCSAEFRARLVELSCQQCGISFWRSQATINNISSRNKSGNVFCSRLCANTYNILHRKHPGCRRSKLEIWLEEQLRSLYPDLKILFSAREAINSELDIHFPDLKLAFELNGIFHYEPIHGQEQLTRTQNNDHRKFAACIEKGIALCIVDVSGMKYFKPNKGRKFLDIIVNIVETKR